MHKHEIDSENRQIKSVTYFGLIINVVLTLAKVIVGLMVGSMSLVADGIHSLSDMSTDFAVLLGVYLGAKKPDQCHPYGHGRAETFSSGFIAIVLAFVGGAMIYYASVEIVKGNVVKPNLMVFVIALISVASKEYLYQITRKIAIKSHCTALYANAWHHRSDALSSVAVAIGYVALRAGFDYGDQLATVAVGLMIVFVAVQIIGQCLRELTEGSVDRETVENIKRIINSNSQVRQWHKLRSRMVGREVFLDLHILVDPELNITDAHEIAETLEKSLHKEIVRPVNITVHVEPDIPELRLHGL